MPSTSTSEASISTPIAYPHDLLPTRMGEENAHRITLKGGSMRRLYDSTKEADAVPGDA